MLVQENVEDKLHLEIKAFSILKINLPSQGIPGNIFTLGWVHRLPLIRNT